MHSLTCPECRASLDADAIESTGVWECPYCGKPLPETQEESIAIRPRGDAVVATNEQAISDSAPAGSLIEVHEASDERLVIFVPPGGKGASGLGCFATMWNLFNVVFTTMWLSARPKDAAALAFIGFFWLVGIGLLIGWVKLKYERTLLLVEPSRVVVQHILFGRKRQKETELFSKSRATLTEAYSQNDVPVYSVAIEGKERTIRFGTSLSNAEKDWLVERINALIAPNELTKLTATHRNTEADDSDADVESRPDTSGDFPEAIQIIEDSPDRLSLRIPAVTFSAARWALIILGGLFSLAWFSGVATMAAKLVVGPNWGVGVMAILAFVPLGAAGLMPLVISLFAWQGCISVTLDRELLTARWHIGAFGITRTMPFADIANVRKTIPTDSIDRPRNARPPTTVGSEGCVVTSKRDNQYLLLTFLNDDSTVRHVTALLKRKWHSFRPSTATPRITNNE